MKSGRWRDGFYINDFSLQFVHQIICAFGDSGYSIKGKQMQIKYCLN